MLIQLDQWAKRTLEAQGFSWAGLRVISGYRSTELQARLNPDAPNSRHRQCPATAADLRLGPHDFDVENNLIWDWLGAKWALMGGRWGGRFRTRDQNHFDLGVGHDFEATA